MIRGAHVITNLTTGGAEMMFYRMLQVMDRSRFEAEVFSLKQNHPVGDKIAELGVPVRALVGRSAAQNLSPHFSALPCKRVHS
jgi:hypothetical protein